MIRNDETSVLESFNYKHLLKHIPELGKTSVLRARNRTTGEAAFIISSDLGSFPLESASGIESMGYALDFARLALQKEKNDGDI